MAHPFIVGYLSRSGQGTWRGVFGFSLKGLQHSKHVQCQLTEFNLAMNNNAHFITKIENLS